MGGDEGGEGAVLQGPQCLFFSCFKACSASLAPTTHSQLQLHALRQGKGAPPLHTAAVGPVPQLLTAHLGQRGVVEIHNGDHLAQTSRPP